MKVCTKEHVIPAFGSEPVPVGSLWDDESVFITGDNVKNFKTVKADESKEP